MECVETMCHGQVSQGGALSCALLPATCLVPAWYLVYRGCMTNTPGLLVISPNPRACVVHGHVYKALFWGRVMQGGIGFRAGSLGRRGRPVGPLIRSCGYFYAFLPAWLLPV